MYMLMALITAQNSDLIDEKDQAVCQSQFSFPNGQAESISMAFLIKEMFSDITLLSSTLRDVDR